MLKRSIKDQADYLPLLLRAGLGLVLIPQGFSMVTNYHDTLDWLTGDVIQMPMIIAYFIIIVEFYGSLFLILGLASKLMAGALGLVVSAAIPFHFTSDTNMDWVGQYIGSGISLHLLIIVLAVILVMRGSGKWSVDEMISHIRV